MTRDPFGGTPESLAHELHKVAEDKQAWEPVIIDLGGLTTVADYFVICEGETDRQVKAIADAMVERGREIGARPLRVDGYDDASWILIDFDSVLVHIFLPGERAYYDLEGLWSAAQRGRSQRAAGEE
ncbi:MAG TPA: ribosome silencing factor [Candidatus Dormibacteraeota bacterium]|nr:ribosome silencing factor [Candidatus Dormibacteraeota bacterium]